MKIEVLLYLIDWFQEVNLKSKTSASHGRIQTGGQSTTNKDVDCESLVNQRGNYQHYTEIH